MSIHERIKSSRLACGLSMQELGDKVGVTAQSVNQWENGGSPRTSKIEQIAHALNVSPEWLQFGIATEFTHREIQLYDYKLSAGKGNSYWVENKKELPLVFCKQWFRNHNLNPNNLRAMHVKGDSMQPELKDNDTVIIDITDLEIVDGSIYAFVYKEKLYIKRIKHIEDGIALISANPEYDTMNVTLDTSDRFQLLGRMVWRGG